MESMKETKFSIIGDVTQTKKYKALLKEAKHRPFQGMVEGADFIAKPIMDIQADVEEYFRAVKVAFFLGKEMVSCDIHVQAILSKDWPIVLTIRTPAILIDDVPSEEVLTYLSAYDCGAVIIEVATNQVIWPSVC